nr:uncharacterized protein LOC117995729 [Maniola hyperantus]
MEPPSFSTTGPQVVRAAPGSDASLVLSLPSGSPPFHYEWSRAGAKLDDRFKPTHGAGGVRLTISTVSTGDSGVYTLQASNAAGKDTTRVRLEVSPDEKPTGEDPPTFLRRLQDLTVKVGTRTRFLVEIVSSTECRVTWYRNERRLLEAERIALVRDGNFWCADISAVSVDDAGRWTCTAENVGGRASCSAHLNVLVPKAYKRPEFVEELRALLTEQGTVSLECKVVGVPTPVLRWFKDSREIKAGDVFALTANAEDPTSLGTYTCEAVNCMGRAYSSSKVHVIGRTSRESSARPTSGGMALEPPPIFTKELEDQFARICEPLTLSCNIVVPPWPRSIVWYNKEGKIEPSEKYRVLEDGVGGYLLEVPSAEWPDEGEWKCVATSSGGRIGITTCYVSMDVPKNYRKPRFMENLQAVLTEEGLVSFECKVVGFPTPVLSWFKDGQELKPGDVYQLTGTNSLGSYCCIARNCMGQASSSAELTVEDIQNQLNEEEKLQLFSKNQAPKFLQGLKSAEAKIDEPFRLTIKVAIPPEPTVLWYRDDQPVDESSRCHHGKEERGVFFLDIQSLEFMDQAEWKCVAMNDFGHSETSCFLKLIIPRHFKKPRFLENLQAVLSDEGAVNLECKVIGVPQPVLKWYKDGEELKPGDIHRIISGQDGTCCLGTYTCEAQNCMGIAASSASLLGFEDSIKAKSKKKVDEQTLQRNLSLSTIHEERTSQMYDTPIGDITLDDKGEISFSFDGKEVSVSLYETPDLTEEEALQIVEMYADQLSENVTEHNVVELPPLRFVKETSTSGNLLMEAIIIDVSPEYFTSPEEDLRTEADIEDISIADESCLPHLSLDQEIDGEDYLEKTMARLSIEKADFPKKTDRKKSDSQKSADDYFSLSRDQSLSEEKKDDETQALSESDLQSFASARSSGKVKSKSSKPSIEDGQESSDVTKTVLLKEDLQSLRQQNEIDLAMKNVRERERRSQSSRRSSSSSEKSLNKIKEENFDGNFANVLPTIDQQRTNAEIHSVCSTLTKLINDVQMIERDIILKSELMSTAATASRSLEIINSLITPLSEIHSIAEATKETVRESLEVTASLFNRLPQPLGILNQSLTIIEKCIDLKSENKTLVKQTCTNIIEKCADELNKLVNDISSIVNKDCLFLEDACVSSIHSTNSEIVNTITYSVAAIKEYEKVSDKIDTSQDKITPELKHLQKTQKAVYELRNPLKSLLHITEAVDIFSFISAEHINNTQIILNDMSTPIQALQSALEQIEFLSVTETQSGLQKYNTEIMETVMDSVIKLRTSFEQLSVEAGTAENINILEKVLVDIKHNINEISVHLIMVEAKIGSFDVLNSENKLEALQKMAQILINLENNLVVLDIDPCLKIHMANFHKNLTKVLEHVIESNDAKKYLTLLEICDGVNRLNALIKNMHSNDILSLAGICNNLKIIQANIKKNEFTPDLNFSISSNINDLLINIHETMNHADISTYSMMSENLEDLSIKHFEEGKLNIVLEKIEKAISTISNVVSLETTKDLDIKQALNKIIPTLEEIKCCVATLNVNVIEREENISDMSNFTFTQAVANPLCELNLGISVLNQIICEKALDCCENELKVELMTPLLELNNALEVLQQDVISQNDENINNLSINSSVANVVQSIQSCILMIQEQDLLENADELSTLDDISAIKTSADILSSDHLLTSTVHEMTTEIDTQVTTEFETQIMQSVSAKILRKLYENTLMLQKPEIMEILDDLSKHDEYASIQSITTGINTIHCAIEDILHPVILEKPQELSNFISPTRLSAIMQPVQDLYRCLSVIDKNNMPIESALKKDQTKFLSQYLSKLEDCLRESIDCLHVAIETADVTLEISTQIDKLRKLCVELKSNLDTAKIDAFVECSEFIMLDNSLTTVLDTTDCAQEINISRLKLTLERLQQNIALAKDEILGFTVENPVMVHHETKILKSVADIEKSIFSLAQLQFVNIGQVSDFDYCVAQRVGKVVNCDQLNKIENIIETTKNFMQQLPLDMSNNNNLVSMKKFVKTFNDEITLLCCLFNQKPTPKRMVKMLQLFYDLYQNLKEFQLHQEKSHTSEDFNGWMATFEQCLSNIQALLLELLDSQHNLIFDIPISNILNVEFFLNKLLKPNDNANLHHFLKLLADTIESIKPWFENIHADVVEELESCNFNFTVDDDADKNLALLSKYLSDITETKDIKDKFDFENILRVIQKNADYKNIRGTGKKIIFIKCISDCFNILKQTLSVLENSQERELVRNSESTTDAYELKKLLTELSRPIKIVHETIMHICDENLQITDKSIIYKHLELLESQAKAINETWVAEKLLKFDNLLVDTFSDFATVNLAKDILFKIHSMQNSLENMESALSVDLIMNIQPIKEIEKILNTLFADKVVHEEKSQFKDKSDSLLQHMEQYIEIIEIVEEVSAVIKLDDFKKSANIVRELRESITSKTSPDINLAGSELSIREEQIQLAQNLQKALTTLQIDAFDSEQELAPLINDDMRHQIIEVISDLQNDLVALTSIDVVLENSELIENDKQIEQKCIMSIQEEEGIASIVKEVTNGQYAIRNSEGNLEESLNVINAELVTQCDFPVILEIEETQHKCEGSTTPSLDVCDQKLSLEQKSDVDLLHLKMQDSSEMKFNTIKEILTQHINDYLRQDTIDDIKKLLPSENFEQLERSLQIAVEVHDNVILEDSYSPEQQVFLKNLLELVLKLQEATSAIYNKNLYDENEQILQPVIGQTAKTAVHNLLHSLRMYVALINSIIESEGVKDDSQPVTKQTCEGNVTNATITEINISDENIFIDEDSPLAILNEKQRSELDFERETNSSTVVEEGNNLNDVNALPEDIYKTRIVGNENDEFNIVLENQKLDEKTLKLELTEPEESSPKDPKSPYFLATNKNLTDMNITDSFIVQEESIDTNNRSKTEGEINCNTYLNKVNTIMDNNVLNVIETTTLVQDKVIAAREDIYTDKEKSNAVLELETLLQEVNEIVHLSEDYPVIQNSEELQDILEEVQTVILKLKCDFDGSRNDILNENIEDLECNVRSVQLQINENCPPALFKEACANLQTLATCIKNIHSTQDTFSKENNALYVCINEAELAIEILDKVHLSKVDFNLDNIILNLNGIKNTMKSLKSCFMDDAESLILRGIEVLQHLDHVEEKVFALEKELEANNEIDVNFRDSIIAATHSMYGSISNMRSNLCSIQKKYMYDNYGKPSIIFFKSIKNVNLILSYDNNDDWKKFAKSLRKVLKHFEDVKFYINFDKTARLPSDSAFTKILLGELNTMLSIVVLQNTKDLDSNLTDQVKEAVNYISETLNKMENRTTLEVKEKIPIFKELSNKMCDITDTIRILVQTNIDNINQPLKSNEKSGKEENIEKTRHSDTDSSENDENRIINIISAEFTNVTHSISEDNNKVLLNKKSLDITRDENEDTQQLKELKEEKRYIEESKIQMIELDDINRFQMRDDTTISKNKIENDIPTSDSCTESVVVTQNDNEIRKLDLEKGQDIEKESNDILNEPDNHEISQKIVKAEQNIRSFDHPEEVPTPSGLSDIVTESLKIEEVGEDKIDSTMSKQLTTEDLKEQIQSEMISLDSLPYTEQKYFDVKENIETSINENIVEKTKSVQQDEEKKEDVDLKIESVKLENKERSAQNIKKDLLADKMTDTESCIVDGKMAVAQKQIVDVSEFSNTQENADDHKIGKSENDITDIDLSEPIDVETIKKEEKIQNNLQVGINIEEDIVIEKITETDRSKPNDKIAGIQIVEESVFSNSQSTAEMKDDPKKEKSESNIKDVSTSESKDLKIVKNKEEDIQGDSQEVGIKESEMNSMKIFEGQEIEIETVVKTELDINIVKNEQTSQEDFSFEKYDKNTPMPISEELIKEKQKEECNVAETDIIIELKKVPISMQIAKTVEIAQHFKTEDENEIISQKQQETEESFIIQAETTERKLKDNTNENAKEAVPLENDQQCKNELPKAFIDNENSITVENTNKAEIVREVCGSQDLLYESMTEDKEKTGKFKEKDKDRLQIKAFKSKNNEEQDNEIVLISKEILNEDENVKTDKIVLKSKESDIAGLNQKQITEINKIKKENENQLFSAETLIDNENSITVENTDKAEIIREVCGSQDLVHESKIGDIEIKKENEKQLFSAETLIDNENSITVENTDKAKIIREVCGSQDLVHESKIEDIEIKKENEKQLFSANTLIDNENSIPVENTDKAEIIREVCGSQDLVHESKTEDIEIKKENEKQLFSAETLIDNENSITVENTDKTEIIKEVCGSQDLVHESKTEDIEKAGKFKDRLPITVFESKNNEEQDNEIVLISKELLNEDENVNRDKIILESKESDMTGLNQSQITEINKTKKENKNQLFSVNDKPRCKMNEEECQENQSNQSKLCNSNEKNLQDQAKKKECATDDTLLEDIASKQQIKKLGDEEPLDIETSKGLILSDNLTDSNVLLGKQSVLKGVETEKENELEEHFKDKINKIEPKIKSESENSEIQVTSSNIALQKGTDSKASDENTNIEKEMKCLSVPKQKTEHIGKEQDQQLETSENADMQDDEFKKQDVKPKTKVKIKRKNNEKRHLKKQEEAKYQSVQNKQETQTENVEKELKENQEENEHNKNNIKIKTGEEHENNVKPIKHLGEQPITQSDKSKDQIKNQQNIPQETLLHDPKIDDQNTIETEQYSGKIVVKNKENETAAVQFQDSKQQQKTEKEEKDEILKIIAREQTCTIDDEQIEKKETDSYKKLMKIENRDKQEKELGEIDLIETDAINFERDEQKQHSSNILLKEINEKIKHNTMVEPNTSETEVMKQEQNVKKSGNLITKEEETLKLPRDIQKQAKIINYKKNAKDVTETSVICGLDKANEYEILKPDESLSVIPIRLIGEVSDTKKLQKTENVITECQVDKKHTLAEDYSLHDQSPYYTDELQSSVQEQSATNSVNIQESNLLSRNEIKLDSKVSRYKDIKQRPSFTVRSEPDYAQEFSRPPGYTTKLFDTDNSPMEIQTTSKSPTIYRAQTLVQESQLKSSLPPYINQRSNSSEGRTELKQKSNTTSDSKNTISEKRGSYPRDFTRKPVFSTHLTDRTAVESSRVKLTCSVLSSSDPKISWYKNGTLLDNKHKCRTKCVDGLITLEILNAVPCDSGEYSCTVENENGSVTSSANLKVYPCFEASPIPPTFTRSIRDIYHLHENELVLECRIRGQPLPTITWFKDNRPILLNERYQAHYLADGVCRLTILSPNEDDSGKYTCKAENSMWSDQITHEVYFTSKERRHIKNIASSEYIRSNRQATELRRPHFTNVLSDHKVVSGGTIGLQVEISGSPTRVEWLREGQSVTETYRNAQTYIDRGLYTLALSDVTEKESGLYTCRAWSTHGTVDMNASITVVQPNQFEGKPATIISRPVKDLLISVGEDLNISFRVQGEPKPKVFFMKGIRDITNSQRVCKMSSDDYVKFTLKRSVIADAGTYCVFARNAYGCDRAFVTVVIRQRASSDHLISDWTYPMDDLAISVVDRNYQSVPDRIPSEPSTVDGGNNWVSLAWPKPVSQVKAPILAYKVENWLLGKEGGARWVELGITPRNCFDAFNLKQGEEYHFRVTPRNRYGWGESVQTSIPIRIGLAGDRPEFIEILPGQLKVLVGETATLCCSFKGNPMPEIVWMKNGHEVEEESERVVVQLNGNNTSLQINDIKIEDEGRYSCEATNVHGRSSTYSRMAVITDRQIWTADAKLKRERSAGANGEYPPQFTMRLRDRRVQATYPVRLTCQVIGSPSPIVTWFKDGEEVSVDGRRTTSQDEYFYTLEIAPTTLDDGGVYEAMARNGCGAISCRCNLVVDKGIRAYIAPEFCCGFEPLYRVCEGDELRISAVVEAYPSVGVTWYRDGVRLRTSRRAIMTLDRDGQIELALASVAARDAGVYTCTASNEVGRASTSGKVEVVKGEQTSETPKVPPIVVSPDLPYSKEPMFIKKPRSSEAHEGDTVIIECEVIGDPKPEVYWLRDFLKPDYYRDSSHFKRVGAGPAYRFEIPHAKFDYTGAYSIVAKNIHGEAKAIISLQILAKDSTCSDDTHNIRYGRVEVIPRFDKELTDLLCYDGDAIEFECRVSGNPEPDIRWIHYNEVLPECPDFETSYNLGTARLKIKQVTAEDEGTYTCEASNNLGKATTSGCLVIYPPGEPNTLSQRLRRPPALLSASSTPRSTPRTTPARSLSRTPGPDFRRLCSPSREIAPKFYTYPYNKVVEEGDTVVFQCAVRGLPPPWATWDKDGIIITPTARISIREKEDMFRILEIEQVTIEDVGLYRVTLENDYGRAEASARLEVISQAGKFYGSRSYSVSPRKCLPYRRRTPSLTRQD